MARRPGRLLPFALLIAAGETNLDNPGSGQTDTAIHLFPGFENLEITGENLPL